MSYLSFTIPQRITNDSIPEAEGSRDTHQLQIDKWEIVSHIKRGETRVSTSQSIPWSTNVFNPRNVSHEFKIRIFISSQEPSEVETFRRMVNHPQKLPIQLVDVNENEYRMVHIFGGDVDLVDVSTNYENYNLHTVCEFNIHTRLGRSSCKPLSFTLFGNPEPELMEFQEIDFKWESGQSPLISISMLEPQMSQVMTNGWFQLVDDFTTGLRSRFQDMDIGWNFSPTLSYSGTFRTQQLNIETSIDDNTPDKVNVQGCLFNPEFMVVQEEIEELPTLNSVPYEHRYELDFPYQIDLHDEITYTSEEFAESLRNSFQRLGESTLRYGESLRGIGFQLRTPRNEAEHITYNESESIRRHRSNFIELSQQDIHLITMEMNTLIFPDLELPVSKEVHEKSKDFLLSILDEHQKNTFEKHCYIEVIPKSGNIYRIITDSSHQMNVYELKDGIRAKMLHCAHLDENRARMSRPEFSGKIPLYDHIAAQVIMLKSNETGFLEIANHFPCEGDAHIKAQIDARRCRNERGF